MIDVDVAILDSGISLEHPDLNVYRNVSFVNYTGFGNDDNGHGTHVAGTVAALNNSFGVVGVAPGARLWSVKVCDDQGSCNLSDQIKGVQYVIDHADEIDVVNMSIENIFSPTLNAVIQEAVKRGITFVVPAGNSFRDAANTSPANSPYVLSVSAMIDTDGFCGGYGIESFDGQDDEFAWFSNFGKEIDLSAPGVDILSTYYGTEYAIESGTSMAAPHVTGIAALLKSRYPGMTPLQTYKTLINASIGPGALCDKDLGGYFSGDVDSIQERMVQIPGLITKNN
jgi:subtilisin family serine protease